MYIDQFREAKPICVADFKPALAKIAEIKSKLGENDYDSLFEAWVAEGIERGINNVMDNYLGGLFNDLSQPHRKYILLGSVISTINENLKKVGPVVAYQVYNKVRFYHRFIENLIHATDGILDIHGTEEKALTIAFLHIRDAAYERLEKLGKMMTENFIEKFDKERIY